MKKIVVSDYDGTFYINEEDIKRNKISVNNFIKDGNIFAIATGRSYKNFKEEIKKYNLNYNYVILNHGSQILDKENNIISNYYIDNSIIDKIYKDLEIKNAVKYSCHNLERSNLDFKDKDINKINVGYKNKEKAIEMSKKIKEKYSKYVNVYYIPNNDIEIISNQTNKSKAIEKIVELENINKRDVYTIGDSYNDIEMITNFNGYCIRKSVQELIDICKDNIVDNVSTLFEILFKKDLYDFLNDYDFFKNLKEYEIISIQDYGRRSKFKIKSLNDFYTLILTENRIKPYIEKIKVLGKNFEDIVGLKYLSKDNKVLVLDYYGNDKGLDVIKLECNNYPIDDDIYVKQFKKILDNIHKNKINYVNFDKTKKYNKWEDYYKEEILLKIDSIKNILIDEKIYKLLKEKLEESLNLLDQRENTFIHADITPLNVCINPYSKKLYLIDYDDFKIGDPLMDISRILNFKNDSKLFKKVIDKYYKKYENNLNHLFYTLRVNINWYNHIIKNNQEDIYDLKKVKEDILNLINQILKH